MPEILEFVAFRDSGKFFPAIFPEFSLNFPPKLPHGPQKQPQPSRVFWKNPAKSRVLLHDPLGVHPIWVVDSLSTEWIHYCGLPCPVEMPFSWAFTLWEGPRAKYHPFQKHYTHEIELFIRKILAPIKIKSAIPPPPPTPPPQKNPKRRNFMDMVFPAERTHFPGAHKIGSAISGPGLADTNITDTRIFLNLGDCSYSFQGSSELIN